MRVAWLHDDPGYVGGAELTMAEFQAAAPDGTEFVAPSEAEVVVMGNCAEAPELNGQKVVHYHHDLRSYAAPESATHIFCSPLQREAVGLGGECIPPALDLDRFRPSRQVRRNADRAGTICVGAYMNPGKGGHLVAEWAQANGGVDFAGFGPYAPLRSGYVADLGEVSQADLPTRLWGYERFVFLPTALEPFGRAVVEAWAAGLGLVVNRLIGALHWITERPEKLETAAEDFWSCVLA